MTEEILRERVVRLETRMDVVDRDISEIKEFETTCADKQTKAIEKMGQRLDYFITNEVKHLKLDIEKTRKEKRQPLSPADWAKIIVAIIGAAGLVLATAVEIVIRYRF